MPKEMLINVSEGEECRIALVEDGRLEELYMERTSATSHVGNIYKGRVTNVEPSIQAAFVDFGLGRNGFLHISDLMPSYFGRAGEDIQESVGRKMARRDRPPIQRCLRRGDEIIVQIIKEGIGTKGPTLSTYLSIPGRILVMMPGMSKLGVSRKIEDEEERRRLRRILDELKPPRDCGFIIRTAGVGKTKAEIQKDLNYLTRLWQNIEKKIREVPPPVELYTEGDLVTRTVRDVYTNDVERIVVDNADVAERVRDFIKIAQPRSRNTVEFYDDAVPLFHRFGIEKEIELMYSRHVPLPSGGSLVIDSTEAIVAIDVNSGKFRDHADAELTAFKTDLEAADEIARQLRLRDLGGVIICDFIDLRYERHRRELEKRLHDHLKNDRAKTKMLRMSQFGIVEMTRQRMRPSLKRSVYFDCPHCKGAGLVKTPESMALDVMRRLAIAMNDQRVQRVELGVAPEVAFYLQNRKRAAIADLEYHFGKRVIIHSDVGLGMDETRMELFDSREGLVFLEELGMAPTPMGGGGAAGAGARAMRGHGSSRPGGPQAMQPSQQQQQQGRRDDGRSGQQRGGTPALAGAGGRRDQRGGGGGGGGRDQGQDRRPDFLADRRELEADAEFDIDRVEDAVESREEQQQRTPQRQPADDQARQRGERGERGERGQRGQRDDRFAGDDRRGGGGGGGGRQQQQQQQQQQRQQPGQGRGGRDQQQAVSQGQRQQQQQQQQQQRGQQQRGQQPGQGQPRGAGQVPVGQAAGGPGRAEGGGGGEGEQRPDLGEARSRRSRGRRGRRGRGGRGGGGGGGRPFDAGVPQAQDVGSEQGLYGPDEAAYDEARFEHPADEADRADEGREAGVLEAGGGPEDVGAYDEEEATSYGGGAEPIESAPAPIDDDEDEAEGVGAAAWHGLGRGRGADGREPEAEESTASLFEDMEAAEEREPEDEEEARAPLTEAEPEEALATGSGGPEAEASGAGSAEAEGAVEEAAAAGAEAEAEPVEADAPATKKGKRTRRGTRGGRGRGRKKSSSATDAGTADAAADAEGEAEASPEAAAPKAAEAKSETKAEAGKGTARKSRSRRGSGGGGGRGRGRGGKAATTAGDAAEADAGGGGGSPAAAEDEAKPAASPAEPARPVIPTRTGSSDKHLIHDEPVDPPPVTRPRTYRDLDHIPDDLD